MYILRNLIMIIFNYSPGIIRIFIAARLIKNTRLAMAGWVVTIIFSFFVLFSNTYGRQPTNHGVTKNTTFIGEENYISVLNLLRAGRQAPHQARQLGVVLQNINRMQLPSKISDEDFNLLVENTPNLKILDLTGCARIKDFSKLAALVFLMELNVSNTNFSDQDVQYLIRMQRLASLNLSNCLSLKNLSMLGVMPAIKVLNLTSTNIVNLAPLRNLKNLQILELGECTAIKDFTVLESMPSLTKLNLSDDLIHAGELRIILKTSTQLKEINLTACRNILGFSKKIANLELDQLEFLYLQGSNYSENDLEWILRNVPNMSDSDKEIVVQLLADKRQNKLALVEQKLQPQKDEQLYLYKEQEQIQQEEAKQRYVDLLFNSEKLGQKPRLEMAPEEPEVQAEGLAQEILERQELQEKYNKLKKFQDERMSENLKLKAPIVRSISIL